jgi:hypothetical protein
LKVKPAYLKTIIFDKENRIKALNQVVAADYKGNSIEVPVESLDYILEKLQPTLIKIDVEGFEPEVIEGSRKILTSDSVLAVLLETVDPSIEKILRESGFQPTSYDPFKRELKTSAHNHLSNNYLWIRNLSKIADRCKTAPKYQVLGVNF